MQQHKPDFVHFSRCPSMECHNSNIGETVKHLSKRVIDQAGRDTKSHIVRHCSSSYHKTVNIENFKILNMEYNKNTYKRRMSKALFVKSIALPTMGKTALSLCSFSIDFNSESIGTL